MGVFTEPQRGTFAPGSPATTTAETAAETAAAAGPQKTTRPVEQRPAFAQDGLTGTPPTATGRRRLNSNEAQKTEHHEADNKNNHANHNDKPGQRGPEGGIFANLKAAAALTEGAGFREATPFDALTEEYTARRLERGTSALYARNIQMWLNRLAVTLVKRGRAGWQEVTPVDVGAHLASLKTTPAAITNQRTVIHAFLSWASGEPERRAPQFKHPRPCGQPRPGEVDRTFTAEEIRALQNAKGAVTAQLAVELGYGSGMRAGEIANLTPESVDLQKRQAAVRLKGRTRIVHLTAKAVKLLELYTSRERPRRARPTSPENWLLTRHGTAAANKDVNRWVQEMARRAGITRRVTSHMLRHTFGATLLESGAEMETISKLLGHADTKTTRIYTVPRQAWLAAKLKKHHPGHK